MTSTALWPWYLGPGGYLVKDWRTPVGVLVHFGETR